MEKAAVATQTSLARDWQLASGLGVKQDRNKSVHQDITEMKYSILLICDPQIDLIDSLTFRPSMPIPGAEVALQQVIKLIDRAGSFGIDPLTAIAVMRETNRTIDIINPNFWLDANGNPPPPYTVIYHDDVRNGKWIPRQKDVILRELSRKSILEHCLSYTHALETKGKLPLIIWPTNCIDGTRGHNIYPELMGQLTLWEQEEFAAVDFINKTPNHFVEMHGPIEAEYQLKADPSTSFNPQGQILLSQIQKADIVGFSGLTLSVTLMITINQLMQYLPNHDFSKFYILLDCCAVLPKIGELDFPTTTKVWLEEVQAKGVQVIHSEDFLTHSIHKSKQKNHEI